MPNPGDHIKALRKERALRQQDVADRGDVPRSTVCAVEGGTEPKAGTLARIGDGLDLNDEELGEAVRRWR